MNLLIKFLGKEISLENFQRRHSLILETYHGGQYIGPDCDKIFANLDDLENEVLEQNPSCVPFVDALRDLKEVYYISHAKELIQNHREIIKKIENSCMKLHSEFSLPLTPKLHIIFAHLPEYFEMTGKTLRRKTDQTVETTHSKLDKFIKNHNYQIRDVNSEKSGEYLLRAIKHFNSYNLR